MKQPSVYLKMRVLLLLGGARIPQAPLARLRQRGRLPSPTLTAASSPCAIHPSTRWTFTP